MGTKNNPGQFDCYANALPDEPMSDELPETCPLCGSPTIFGYGLAGGGLGAYVMCESCDFFAKDLDEEEMPETASETDDG